MSLVPSLVRAMVLVDGEALVLHAGEKPYVLSAEGQLDLSARPLSVETVLGAIAELLPAADQRTLREVGAIERELAELSDFPGEAFSVAAGRGGDDVWVEVRRRFPVRQFPAPATRRAELPPAADIRASQPGVVLPMARTAARADAAPLLDVEPSASEQLLRLAVSRGASAVYLSSGARPSIRVDGTIQPLEGVPVLDATDVDVLLTSLMPETGFAGMSGDASQWSCEISDLGRIRVSRHLDQHGPGAVLRVVAPRASAAIELGLSREILDLAAAPDGLVLVAGPRGSGKRTLISALIDQINRTRQVHVITIEEEINVAHERGTALISQREVPVGRDGVLNAVRAALADDPDVLVIDRLPGADVAALALEAASSGRLVICGCVARSAADALEGVCAHFAATDRPAIQSALARTLRSVVLQVIVSKAGGGRLTVREILLNNPLVSSAVGEGRTAELPMLMDVGRKQGMTTLAEALASLVRVGTVDLREAVKHAYDQPRVIAALRRHGIDTSSIERAG